MSLKENASCDPKGWECLEKNFRQNFNNFSCAVTCEGIYADVQLALLGEEEKGKDKEKVFVLMQQYNDFKRRTLPNFRFNPEKDTAHYSKSSNNY